eukprot:3932340-Rhodomonas_salina.1
MEKGGLTGWRSSPSERRRGLRGGSRVRHATGHVSATCARCHEAGGHVTRGHVTRARDHAIRDHVQ